MGWGGRARFLAAALLLLTAGCRPPEAEPAALEIDIVFESYTLDNGLEVILHADHRVPIASVNVWYHVGPAREVAGRRGFAHLFEHMMLQGSGHAPGDYISRLQAVGATGVNGNTDFDRTAFLQDVPSDRLDLALWAESDRMGFLLDAVDSTTLANQQAVVRNERRQRIDNAPYGLAQEEVYRQLFPPDHPYHHYIFGSHEDVQSAGLEDVRRFFRQYFAPNNASLAIAGNIDIARTKQVVERYFGSLPPGPEVPEPEVAVPEIDRERRAFVTDDVELPRVYLAWITPGPFTAGDAQAVLAARMLGGGKASRLYRDLVHDLQIAQSVTAEQRSLSHGSVFQITATARPGHTAAELETAIDRTVSRMAREGPGAAELRAAQMSTLAVTVRSLESTDVVADRLNSYNHFLDDPGFFQEDLRRFADVTSEEVARFTSLALDPERRVVVHVAPGPRPAPPDFAPPALSPEPEPQPAPVLAEPWRSEAPPPNPAPAAPRPDPQSFRLDNELLVHLVRRPELPLATVQLTARSGSAQDPPELPGLAAFTADMLNEGAGDRGALEIANDLTALGSHLVTGASREGSWAIVQTLRPSLDSAAEILADVVRRPTFAESEIARIRQERLAALSEQRAQPATSALKVMWREEYGPGHPYSHLTLGTEPALRSIGREAIRQAHRRTFTPANCVLILTGDLTLGEARDLAERAFGDWDGPAPERRAAPDPQPSAERALLVDRPGAPQTNLILSQPAPARGDPEFDRLLLVNAVLGDLFSSRLNQSLRETFGFTYGVDSSLTQGPVPGLLYTTLAVEARHTGASIQTALAEMTRLRDAGLARAELDEAREAIVRSLDAMFRTNDSVASTLAHLYVMGLAADHFSTLEERLGAVSPAEANDLARRWLRPERVKVVAVGDRAAVVPQLEALNLGPVHLRTTDGEPG